MITAVDTNVIVDVLQADPAFGARSRQALERCGNEGRLIACSIVWAEVGAGYPAQPAFLETMDGLGIEFFPTDGNAAWDAGHIWRAYRTAGGDRTRLIADFLVGAHALHHADRLLTRDRGFFRRYFQKLAIIDPARHR